MVFGKTVFLRADVDIPISSSELRTQNLELIEDDTRLLAWMPTLKYLLTHGAKVIIGGHLGRPSGIDKSLSLEPIAMWLNCHHDTTKTKVGEFEGWRINDSIFLLENLRFYKGEEENDREFAKKLASIADMYVNDAFAASHRAHASIVGVPKYLPHFAGFRLEKEIEALSKVLENPDRPLVVIVGGAKIETKLPLVEKMHDFADYVLVGGKIAQETEALLKVQHEKLGDIKSVLLVADLNQDRTDITPKSIENFLQIISLAKTIVWNGPVGMIKSKIKSPARGEARSPRASGDARRGEAAGQRRQKSKVDTEEGTRELTKGIVKSGAYTVVGGGDTIAFLKRIGLVDKFSFVSTGGGAMLEFLSGSTLPGLQALENPRG